MRKLNWLILTAATLATAGCVESMDSGYPTGSYGYDNYSNGYSNGYYSASSYPSSYYTRPTYVSNNTYVYNPPPRVVTQTRYVPVAVATPASAPRPQPANHAPDHRWNNNHDDRPAQAVRPPSSNDHRQASGNDNRGGNRRGDQDRDGDGRPDRRN